MDYDMDDSDENEYMEEDADADAPFSPPLRTSGASRRLVNPGGRVQMNPIGANDQAGNRAYGEDFRGFAPALNPSGGRSNPIDLMSWSGGRSNPINLVSSSGGRAYGENFNAVLPAPNPSGRRSNPIDLISSSGGRYNPINLISSSGGRAYGEDLNALIPARRFVPINAGFRLNPFNKDESAAGPAYQSDFDAVFSPSPAAGIIDPRSNAPVDPAPAPVGPLGFTQTFARKQEWEKNIGDLISRKYDWGGKQQYAEGGEGTIHLVRENKPNDRVVVIKTVRLPRGEQKSPGWVPNEIQQLESIGLGPSGGNTHDNILDILEYFPPVGSTFAYVMEFCPLDDLEKFTWAHFHGWDSDHDRPHEGLLRSLYIDLLQGLDFLHGATTLTGEPKPRIIHGDIKPANILLTANHKHPGHWAYAIPTAKLCDFGGATAMPDPETPNWWQSSNRQLYTQAWAAPEALLPSGPFREQSLAARLRPSTDVYSVAASIGFVATGFPAKKGGGFQDVYDQLSAENRIGNVNRKYWGEGQDKGEEWWERNHSLVASNDILPVHAWTPENASMELKRTLWPSARAKGLSIGQLRRPEKEYSLNFLSALQRGFETTVENRADVPTLLHWLKSGIDGYIRELIYDEGMVGIDD